MKKKNKLITFLVLFLSIPFTFSEEINISVGVRPPTATEVLRDTLKGVGSGVGNILMSIGSPLLVLLVLIALGSAIGYVFLAVSKRV